MHMAWGGPTACVKARPAAALAWGQATCAPGGCREVYAHAGRQRGATHSEQAACGHEQVQGTGDVEWLSFMFGGKCACSCGWTGLHTPCGTVVGGREEC